jgi:Flp pilus assembly protein TadG
MKSWLEWLSSRERRKVQRQTPPHLVAFYWDGGAPSAHDIRDVSSTGLYLLTEERWYPGTLVRLSLLKVGVPDTDPDRSITVNTKVVRLGQDGVGLEMVMPEKEATGEANRFTINGADRKSFNRFLQQLLGNRGQALIEYVLMLPLIFLLIINLVNFGGFFFAWITVANAARAGADYAIMGGASAGSPGQPSAVQITNVIRQDIYSLPNKASLQVKICNNNSGAITNLVNTSIGCSFVPPADPESSYVLISIDVTYTYIPFIPAGFTALNVYATIPPTTIHRQTMMRIIQ